MPVETPNAIHPAVTPVRHVMAATTTYAAVRMNRLSSRNRGLSLIMYTSLAPPAGGANLTPPEGGATTVVLTAGRGGGRAAAPRRPPAVAPPPFSAPGACRRTRPPSVLPST